MILNISKEIESDSLAGHMILSALSSVAAKEVFADMLNSNTGKESIEADVKLLINEQEVDISDFCEHWQSQVGRLIKEAAKGIMRDKLINIENLLYELEQQISAEIKE